LRENVKTKISSYRQDVFDLQIEELADLQSNSIVAKKHNQWQLTATK
jgi:hypothetical protein